MAKTISAMIPLGTPAPHFQLYDTVSGKQLSLTDIASDKATVIMFLCNHCPYVKHLEDPLVELAKTYQAKGVSFIAISANDIVKYPDDSPDKMHLEAIQHDYPFPYLYDETQDIARAYHAACTPDFFVFDKQLHCVYRGRFDASTPNNTVPVTGVDLQQALDDVLQGRVVHAEQLPSMGCNIKWK